MVLDQSSGFVALSTASEPSDRSLPIFDVRDVQLIATIGADFVAAQVANNVLILALATGRILRIDLDSPEDIDGEWSLYVCTPVRYFTNDMNKCLLRQDRSGKNRHRSSQKVRRDRNHTSVVSGSDCIASDHHNNTRRQLLFTQSVASTETSITFKGFNRERSMESVWTKCIYSGNLGGSHRRECLRGIY